MYGEACLVLANGRVFKGKSFGAKADAVGEVVFTTGMTGYIETLTDPSYYGQIITMTFPIIGNCGIIPGDFESRYSYVKGLIVKEHCEHPSNFRSEGTLHEFLVHQQIPAIYGIDTRALTKELRTYGVMNGAITNDPANVDMDKLRAYKTGAAIDEIKPKHISDKWDRIAIGVSQREIEINYQVALWNFGAKGSIDKSLTQRGCNVYTCLYWKNAQELIDSKPDGIILSNGPGDPSAYPQLIEEIHKLTQSGIPILGICLGHQLLALASGGKTEKMKFGHRGANHPVRDHRTGRVMITSQNHGFTVMPDSIQGNAEMRYTSAHDGSCEGIEYHDFPAFSVQFHPEAAAGPKDTAFLFDKFISMMGDR